MTLTAAAWGCIGQKSAGPWHTRSISPNPCSLTGATVDVEGFAQKEWAPGCSKDSFNLTSEFLLATYGEGCVGLDSLL